MKKSIFTLVVALCAVLFASCDNVAPATETPAADTAKVVTVDSAAAVAPTATAVAVDTTKK